MVFELVKILFVLRVSSDSLILSAAGDLVQKQIFESSPQSEKKYFVAMQPVAVWPKGRLFVKGSKSYNGEFVTYINLPIIREIIFALIILKNLSGVNYVFQYNSYFFSNLVITLFKHIFNYKSIVIMQDYRSGEMFSKKDLLADKMASFFLPFFDGYILITKKFIEFFNLNKNKSIVFPGAITEHGVDALNDTREVDLHEIAVYAGALESHNGVDVLIENWIKQDIDIPLHIFGRGSLSSYVESINNKNIIFHGFQSSSMVYKWQSKAKYNFCLRMSTGLNEEFFFPSKFFNLVCYRGKLIVNDFKNLPLDIKPHLLVLDSDFSNLRSLLNQNQIDDSAKREVILNYQWKYPIQNIIDKLK